MFQHKKEVITIQCEKNKAIIPTGVTASEHLGKTRKLKWRKNLGGLFFSIFFVIGGCIMIIQPSHFNDQPLRMLYGIVLLLIGLIGVRFIPRILNYRPAQTSPKLVLAEFARIIGKIEPTTSDFEEILEIFSPSAIQHYFSIRIVNLSTLAAYWCDVWKSVKTHYGKMYAISGNWRFKVETPEIYTREFSDGRVEGFFEFELSAEVYNPSNRLWQEDLPLKSLTFRVTTMLQRLGHLWVIEDVTPKLPATVTEEPL